MRGKEKPQRRTASCSSPDKKFISRNEEIRHAIGELIGKINIIQKRKTAPFPTSATMGRREPCSLSSCATLPLLKQWELYRFAAGIRTEEKARRNRRFALRGSSPERAFGRTYMSYVPTARTVGQDKERGPVSPHAGRSTGVSRYIHRARFIATQVWPPKLVRPG